MVIKTFIKNFKIILTILKLFYKKIYKIIKQVKDILDILTFLKKFQPLLYKNPKFKIFTNKIYYLIFKNYTKKIKQKNDKKNTNDH